MESFEFDSRFMTAFSTSLDLLGYHSLFSSFFTGEEDDTLCCKFSTKRSQKFDARAWVRFIFFDLSLLLKSSNKNKKNKKHSRMPVLSSGPVHFWVSKEKQSREILIAV